MAIWDAIILTCCQWNNKRHYETELNRLQHLGLLPESGSLVQCFEDPAEDVGSGGATINAILRTVEYLSASEGLTVLDCDVLKEKRVIIFLDGRSSLFDCSGMTFSSVGDMREESTIPLNSRHNFYHLYSEITEKMGKNCPSGVWIVSMDMMLKIETFQQDWSCISSEHVIAFSFPVDDNFAKHNGIYSVENDYVRNILYKDQDYCQVNSSPFHSVSGLLYFSHYMSERLLALYLLPCFEGCTYLGIDNGAKPVRLSLFFDLLASMAPDCSNTKCLEAKYLQDVSSTKSSLHRQNSFVYSGDQKAVDNFEYRSNVLREHFSSLKIRNVLVDGFLSYPRNSAIDYQNCLKKMGAKQSAFCNVALKNGDESVLSINSIIPPGLQMRDSTIIDCEISAGTQPHQINNCILSGMNSKLSQVVLSNLVLNNLCVTCFPLANMKSLLNPYAVLIFSLSDFCHGNQSELMRTSLSEYMKNRGIEDQDIWGQDNSECDLSQSSMNARFFPIFHDNSSEEDFSLIIDWLVRPDLHENGSALHKWKKAVRMSLDEILLHIDMERALSDKRNVLYKRIESEIAEVLTKGLIRPVNHLFKMVVIHGQVDCLLKFMDGLYFQLQSSLTLLARLLATIADLLGCAAQRKGGLRSGPAANPHWLPAFNLLDQCDYRAGMELMQILRADWLQEASLLIRCSRHYEMASQIIIRHAVCTVRNFLPSRAPPTSADLPRTVRVDCPARIDLAGGWSDTPPICYERGGSVVNLSITVNGCKPISCDVTRTNQHEKILIHSDDGGIPIVIDSVDNLFSYDKPYIEGALIKAVLTFVGWDFKLKVTSLCEFNETLFKCSGLNINICSRLPKGSGLGTSSILAGGLLAALWRLQGKTMETLEIVHAVLVIEQMMTTGGGWQDQLGGLSPGVSFGRSLATLPLRVNVESLDVSNCLDDINNRFLLVYTGMTRLARNILQEVIRNWYSRTPQIMEVVDGLHQNAQDCRTALLQGDLESVGKCLDITWNQKKVIARGCEPLFVSELMSKLRPFCDGMSLTGAGGGGFLLAVLKSAPHSRENVLQVLEHFNKVSSRTLDVCSFGVDETGMKISVIEES